MTNATKKRGRKKEADTPVQLPHPQFSGLCNCLGRWCGFKKFFSSDKRYYRFCKKCGSKKDAAASLVPGIKICADARKARV